MDKLEEVIFIHDVTIIGAICFVVALVFLSVYMILERKKKALIVFFLILLGGAGWFFWSLSKKAVHPLPPPIPSWAQDVKVVPPPVKIVPPVVNRSDPAPVKKKHGLRAKAHVPLPKPRPCPCNSK